MNRIELKTSYYSIATLSEFKPLENSTENLWVDIETFETFTLMEMEEYLQMGVIETKAQIDIRTTDIAVNAANIVAKEGPSLINKNCFMATAVGEEYMFVLIDIDKNDCMFIVEELVYIDSKGETLVEDFAVIPFAFCDELRQMTKKEERLWEKSFYGDSKRQDIMEMFMILPEGESKTDIKKDEKTEQIKVPKLPTDYDPSFINASMQIDSLIGKIRTALNKPNCPDCLSLIMSGIPGLGKSLAARYIAEKLGKEIHIKPLATLVDKWVGSTEKNIKAAFDEAEAAGAILVIDEIDAIAVSRDGADRDHTISTVNSLLQAMDMFEGICIFTTNSTDRMDTAVLRRCLLEITFKNLTSDQANRMAKKFFPRRKITGLENETYAPADFSKARDSLLFVEDNDINKAFIMKKLSEVAKTRNGNAKSTNPIGFKLNGRST